MSGIITHTVPTLVGMGVVAQVADRALGRRRSKSTPKKRSKSREPKIHKGSRGGKYIMRKGRKVYI